MVCIRGLPHSATSTPQPQSSNDASLTFRELRDTPETLRSLTAAFNGHSLRRKIAAAMVGLQRVGGLTTPHAAQLPRDQR
jgi:hypothetical protein